MSLWQSQGLGAEGMRPDITVIPSYGDGGMEPIRGDIIFPNRQSQHRTPGLSASKAGASSQEELAIEGRRRIEGETDISVNPTHGMFAKQRCSEPRGKEK